ncbi:unnamed protein product [Spirodela intermedia]|uniref:Uncharacterized protein n=1 Tax=Spirodela intermedia TaxID=51605 RepID=A0A7I8KJ26_SPIIN|nr:unnamed protein product [Spirodela intermedia]
MGSVGNLAYKAFTAGLGVATLYLTFTFGVNVYRGLSWHNAQSATSLFFVVFWCLFFSARHFGTPFFDPCRLRIIVINPCGSKDSRFRSLEI